ncbi:hypothetical protein HPB48_012972 [Haemaphysalis longicornis]|uniref:Uncharacterized protein n=1 Tax=Haemaphysalis longicornis TaxID=44386 RepID=A0A9J6GE65_HAELO|nr:hypothetical protein HPB48_012972 [Haemaphysalis longicornis]
MKLTNSEKSMLHVIIRKSIKCALGLPSNTSTANILGIGVSNTLDELIEAANASEQQRPLSRKASPRISEHLGYPRGEIVKDRKELHNHPSEKLMASLLLTNMTTTHHDATRK